jgi:hypothetical protein
MVVVANCVGLSHLYDIQQDESVSFKLNLLPRKMTVISKDVIHETIQKQE